MDQRGDEVHTSSTEATGASREGVVRWVLIIGLLLAVGLLTVIWLTGALSQSDDDKYISVGHEIGAEQAGAQDQGEPMMPAPGASAGSTDPNGSPSQPAHPDAGTTPGDAPAGDPTNDAQ